MDLKELLGEELYNKVIEKLGDKKIDIVNDGRWIPKAKFDDVNEEKKQYKEQVDNLNKELGKLQKQLEDNQAANETIEKLKQQIKDKETEMEKIRKTNAIKFEVLKANPKDIKDILPHIDDEMVKIEDDAVIGLTEQIEKLKEEKSYLFKEETPAGTGGSKGNLSRSSNEPKVENLRDALQQHYQK